MGEALGLLGIGKFIVFYSASPLNHQKPSTIFIKALCFPMPFSTAWQTLSLQRTDSKQLRLCGQKTTHHFCQSLSTLQLECESSYRQEINLARRPYFVDPYTIGKINFKILSLTLKPPHFQALICFHNFIDHHFFQQIVIKFLLCYRYCAEQWGYTGNMAKSLHSGAYHFWIKN